MDNNKYIWFYSCNRCREYHYKWSLLYMKFYSSNIVTIYVYTFSLVITGASQSDCLVSYPGHWLRGFTPQQLVYFTVPADWTTTFWLILILLQEIMPEYSKRHQQGDVSVVFSEERTKYTSYLSTVWENLERGLLANSNWKRRELCSCLRLRYIALNNAFD